jgi:hypothetical protein
LQGMLQKFFCTKLSSAHCSPDLVFIMALQRQKHPHITARQPVIRTGKSPQDKRMS